MKTISNLNKDAVVAPRLSLVMVGVLLAGACAANESAQETVPNTSVVAAFFPVAEAVERIGGDRVEVTNLTPAGAEPHDLELTTDALDGVLDADLIVYLKGFQPALDEAIGDAKGEVVDVLKDLPPREGDEEKAEHAHDPHVWLDPELWVSAVEKIEDALVKLDPQGAADYRKNAAAYADELEALGDSFEEGLASCDSDLIVTAHGAFGYLTRRYGLQQESISGVSPEAEPDPRHLAELSELVKEEGVTTIFTEELVSPKVAETLASEAGVRTDVLDPIESEPEGGYTAAMRRNLSKVREALGCA